MKKLTALVLALLMVLALCCTAVAETRTYVLTCITDAEGIEKEVEEMPELVVQVDDETMTCVYATAESEEEGTLEMLETRTDEETGKTVSVVLKVTLTGGDVVTMVVYEDQIEILDEANDLCYILAPVAADADAA